MKNDSGKATRAKLEHALQRPVRAWQALAGGMISRVLRVELDDGELLVAKIGDGGHDLSIEAYMMRYLRARSGLPVPAVLHADPSLLIMEYVPGRSVWEGEPLSHLGELLAGCHQVTGDAYGLERDTLTGPLRQPNPQMTSWIAFYREQRLRYMIGVARASGHLPATIEQRLFQLAENLEQFLTEPRRPALIHGDMWCTNVIARNGRIAGIIDPALYYAHNEMELAYMTLFSGTGSEFFSAYSRHIPIEDEFWSTRRHIYNLYPLLVHLTLFGQKYLPPIEETIKRFGY